MSTSADLQKAIVARLSETGLVRVACPVIGRENESLEAKLEETQLKWGLGLVVLPPLPRKAMADFLPDGGVFIEDAEIRVRCIEWPASKEGQTTAYDLVDDVLLALHGWHFPSILAEPLRVRETPTEVFAITANETAIDVFFSAAYQLNESTPA